VNFSGSSIIEEEYVQPDNTNHAYKISINNHLQIEFLICQECFWCASCLNMSKLLASFSLGRCPICESTGSFESIPVFSSEGYRYLLDAKKGVILEFYLRNCKDEELMKIPGEDAIGFAVYSNNERSTELFRWMFELLWNERMVNEKSKRDDKIQDEFINIAAHELRSPAQSIFGYTELMLTDPEYKQLDKKEGYLDAIYRNSLRLTNLTTELLDISRIENQTLQLYKQEFKLNDVIFSVIQDIQKQRKGQTVEVIKDSGARIMYSSKMPKPLKKEELSNGDDNDNNNNSDIFVEADKERITQVLTNLLDNALKFTKENDAISIIVEGTQDNKSNNAEVIIRIKDSGVGIDPEILPFLFTKFRTKPSPVSRIRGTGLGLYICKWIVEAHGGRIWAYNNNIEDKGATVSFSLPILR
jgi:two-component system sensor histidine kinase VicK